MRMCDVCEGTGLTSPDHPNDPSGRTFECWNGCDDGYFALTPKDMEGERAVFGGYVGDLIVVVGVLCLQLDNGVIITNMDPEHVEVLS